MDPFGTTRTRLARNHALIAPDSFVRSGLPGWEMTNGIILIAPAMGAKFVQYIAEMDAEATAGPAGEEVERVAFVLEGEVVVTSSEGVETRLVAGGYVYVPPRIHAPLRAICYARLNIFEKRYMPRAGVEPPSLVLGSEDDVEAIPFLGDPGARLKTLLPDGPAFDLAVNLFTYDTGATLPMVESHVMEHGLIMLSGQGVYRLGEAWYPVQEGDVIWMAPFCPQWFVAMGKSPARYLYYKDVNRDPMETSS
jgi:(S)-ureidoglycine aminohydrolase